MISKIKHSALVLLLLASLLACTPGVAPAPQVTRPAQPAPPLPVTAPLPTNPEDAAWVEVIQAARKEGTVTAYDYFLVGDIGLSVKSAFESKYGIKLTVIPARGAELLERVKTERRLGQMTADYVGSSAANMMNFKREGLTESIANKLPELKDKTQFSVDPNALDSSGQLLGYAYNIRTPYINTKLLKLEEAPKTLQDFLGPKFQGKIIVRDPIVSSGEYLTWIPLLNRGIIDKAYLKALGDQKLVSSPSALDAASRLARGEVSLTTPNSDTSFASLAMGGAPVKAIPLEHGYMIEQSGLIAAIKGAPHPNATLVYLNWRLGSEGQVAYVKASGEAPVRKGVPDVRHPNLIPSGKVAFVATDRDMDDAGKAFEEKMLAALWKR